MIQEVLPMLIQEVLPMLIPGWTIALSGLVYMWKFDKPDEIEIIKELEVIKTVYKEGKEPAKVVYIERNPFANRQEQAFNALGAAQQDPSRLFGQQAASQSMLGALGIRGI